MTQSEITRLQSELAAARERVGELEAALQAVVSAVSFHQGVLNCGSEKAVNYAVDVAKKLLPPAGETGT